jgi:peptide subunit release factor 1 (eRF1)
LLPKTFRVALVSSAAEVLEVVRAANRNVEREAEERLVTELIEAHGRGMAALGLEAVLQAVNEKRVRLLVIGEGLRLSGGECGRCALVLSEPLPAACPACGGGPHPLPDLAARLEDEVLRQGGRIEEVRGAAAGALAPHAGIVARVRYPQPAEAVGARAGA